MGRLCDPCCRLVVEADGPYHFWRNVPAPATQSRDRLLRSWGWEVVSVSQAEYDRLYHTSEQVTVQRLAEHLRLRLPREQ
jgi:very-short-patch-repair endonuclease